VFVSSLVCGHEAAYDSILDSSELREAANDDECLEGLMTNPMEEHELFHYP